MDYAEFVKSRMAYIGASDAPVIIGVSPWKTPYQLWEEKLGVGLPDEDSYAKRKGRETEPEARSVYSLLSGNVVEPRLVMHPTIPYMAANLDGMNADGNIVVEIKCPGKSDHEVAKAQIVPEKYYPQLQHQLAVTGLPMLHYFSYFDGEGVILEVKRDEAYIKSLMVACKKFWDCVESLTPPPMADKDYQQRKDEAWTTAAAEWLRLNRELKALEDKEALAREALIILAGDRSSIGAGVKLLRSVRKGVVNYKSIPNLEGVDLEKYRKPPSVSWRPMAIDNGD